jgi:hypothetical protein
MRLNQLGWGQGQGLRDDGVQPDTTLTAGRDFLCEAAHTAWSKVTIISSDTALTLDDNVNLC